MTGEPYTAVGDSSTIGPPNVGLSPERIEKLSKEAIIRIAAEHVVKEAKKAERAEIKAAAKMKKSAERENRRNKNHDSQSSVRDNRECLERCCGVFYLSNDYKAYSMSSQYFQTCRSKIRDLLKG